ncbi:cytochrome P450 [Nocardia sp. BMG111209]|uniref:cytochrome P450 n=1 Tax=Nocardia sp. BMG111209 TaxID=1160137 RepID=UPI00036E98E9|nr:cytochrome P450 [Nocardia sp. BMG111209]
MTSTQPRIYPFESGKLDLTPLYAELRRMQPLCRVQLPYGEPGWLATRYEDVKIVLGDPRFSLAAAIGRDAPRSRPFQADPGSISSFDPPEHSRLRRLVAQAFTARRIELLRPRVEQIAGELVDAILAEGAPTELVANFALPLPIAVICELLGVPFADRADFRHWSEAFLSTSKYTIEEMLDCRERLWAYLANLVAERRITPQDDLLTALVSARDRDDRLSENELFLLTEAILVAGHETTASQLANFVYVLLNNPQHLAALRADPDLMPHAVEELTRFVPLSGGAMLARYALEDVALGGVTVRAGEPVVVDISSANRDESVYTDAAKLDLRRREAPHLGFGHGPHHCLGAPLARMELRVALRSLIERLPGLRFAGNGDDVVWKSGVSTRGPEQLTIGWDER